MDLDSPSRRPSSIEDVYARSLGHSLLSREQEQELGRRIVEGEAKLLLAVLETGAGRAALRALARDVRSGAKALRDVVRNLADDEADQRARFVELLASLERRTPSCGELARDLGDLRLRREPLEALFLESGATGDAIRHARRAIADARHELITKNLRLVLAFVHRYKNRGLPFLDLVQEGNLGLLHAVDKFDYRRGLRLTTYASWWIKQYIEGALDDTVAMIRVPSYLLEKKRSMLRATRRRQDDGSRATTADLAQISGLTEEVVERIVSAPLEPLSLETPLDGTDGPLLLDVMTADVETPHEAAERSESSRRTLAMLDTLDERERRIIELRFGLGGAAERSCAEIGSELAITGQRVHQIEHRALEKLRARAGAASSRSPRLTRSAARRSDRAAPHAAPDRSRSRRPPAR